MPVLQSPIVRHSRTALLATAALFAANAQAQSILNLGALQEDHNYAAGVAVSANGQYAVVMSGVQFFQQMRSGRWSQGGTINLGVPSDAVNILAAAINADGSAIAGTYYTADRDVAFRWTESGGYQNLGTLDGATFGASATGISADGHVVSGTSSSANGDRAFRWTSNGMQDLGVLTGGDYSFGLAISGDGNTVTGLSSYSDGEAAFVWTASNGMQALQGTAPAAGFAVDANGQNIAGYHGEYAALWTNGVLQVQGTLQGGTFSTNYAISGDGLTTGGVSDNATGDFVATIWMSSTGMLDLNTYLPTLGIDLTGWVLTTTTGLSADGKTIVGLGVYDGLERGWIVTIPAPGSASALALCGMIAARRRR